MTPVAAAPASAQVIEVTVPDIGDASDVDVIEVLVAVGDSIDVDTGLITLETDKATMEVPAPSAGVVKELKVAVGDKVSQGSLVLMLEVSGGAAAPAPTASAPAPEAAPAAAATTSIEVKEIAVPDIGDASDVDVIEVLVAAGDVIEADQGLITLETDKATMEVPAPFAGKLVSVTVKVGDKVSQGSVIASIETQSSAPAAAPAPAPAAAGSPAPAIRRSGAAGPPTRARAPPRTPHRKQAIPSWPALAHRHPLRPDAG